MHYKSIKRIRSENMNKHTEKIRNRYNRVSKFYDIMDKPMEMMTPETWRKEILNGVEGKVLEVGVGTGKNIKYYPDLVDITGIDFSEKMLDKAKEKARFMRKSLKLLNMDVQNLEFEDNTFDYIFTTYVFCSVPDPIEGLKEIKRVLKPGGKLIMLEHVRSKNLLLGLLMDLLNPLVVRMIGANINRNTVENIEKAGFRNSFVENRVGDIVKFISVIND